MVVITRRIFIKPIDAAPKPSAIRCDGGPDTGDRFARSKLIALIAAVSSVEASKQKKRQVTLEMDEPQPLEQPGFDAE
jgi:hypothetical protein